LGACLAILIAVLALLSANPCYAATDRNQCRSCHPVHYADQGGCTDCHHGNPRTSRSGLAHSGLIAGHYASFTDPRAVAVIAGKKLAEQTACRRCHVLAGTGNRLASNLDTLLGRSTPAEIRTALAEPAIFMPNFHFSEQDLDRLTTAVLAGGFQSGKALKEPPRIVHFNDQKTGQQTIFVKQCGGCHKLLSKQHGGLGNGTTGPNLSGLLTRFYPANFEGDNAWNEERLKRWLKNPRQVRSQTLMRPIPLKLDEWEQLLKIISSAD
jgi:cytochrome c2